MGRKSGSGSGIRDEHPGSYFLELRNHFFWFKILKFFDADPGSRMETVRIWDPGWKKVGTGIRDKHPGSATLDLPIVINPPRIRCKQFCFMNSFPFSYWRLDLPNVAVF
jgi:hypothetical protein